MICLMQAGTGSEILSARVLSPLQICWNLAGHLLLSAVAGMFYLLLIYGVTMYLLDRWTAPGLPRYLILAVVALLVAAGLVLCIRYGFRCMTRPRVLLDSDSLLVCGYTSRGLREMRFPLRELQVVAFGHPLPLLEPSLGCEPVDAPISADTVIIRGVKAGELVIVDLTGQRRRFYLVARIFDPASLAAIAAALLHRGVSIQTFA
jgi:hypothetical protein